MSGTGTTTIDFGAGANEAQVSASVPAITDGAKVEAWVMGDDTSADHNAQDHRYFPVFASLTCGTPTAGIGFTVYATSTQKLTGAWTIRFVWAE